MEKIIERASRSLASEGIFIADGLIPSDMIEGLKVGFDAAREKCEKLQAKYAPEQSQSGTIHHALFMHPIFMKVLELPIYRQIIKTFFGGKKFILNSIGGNNNRGEKNYASLIHRDVRFFSNDRLMLNTILNVSGFDDENGATEFLLLPDTLEQKPDEEYFNQHAVSFGCAPGSIIFFDSRIWHRSGIRRSLGTDRIIFTPIFTRPFIKPGFNYSKALQNYGIEKVSEYIKQICGYYSDIPESHEEWYHLKRRRFYMADQDD